MAFQNIFTDGVLVDITIRKWTAEKVLQPSDLGLKSEQVPKTFKLGHKALIPPDEIRQFNQMDHQARQLLLDCSFSFAFGNARFVPKKMFKEYSDKMEILKKEYQTRIDRFIAKYEDFKLAVRPDYVKAAHNAYERMKKLSQAPVDKDGYINQFLQRVDESYPDVKTLRNKFEMDFVVYQVSLPDLTQVTIDDVVSDADKAQLVKDVYKDALNEKIKSYVSEVVGELRGKAKKVIDALYRNLKEYRKMTISSFNMVKDMVEEYEKMNVLGDNLFLSQLTSFKNKYILDNDPKKLRADEGMRREMLAELEKLAAIVCDYSSIDAVANAYRQKIDL